MSRYCVVENDKRLAGVPEYISVSGSFNFYVCIEIKRKPGTTNSSISVTCFTKEDRRIAIASKFKWYQAVENMPSSAKQLNLTANFYQVSPRDINRVVMVQILPFEDGYQGECQISYGPIKVDKSTHARLAEFLKKDFIDIPCSGKSSRTSTPFSRVKADSHELQFYDNSGGLVDTHRINKDMTTHPAMIDSLQLRIISPGGDVNMKTNDADDRDALMLFLQYHIKKKTGRDAGGMPNNDNTLNHSDFFNNTQMPPSMRQTQGSVAMRAKASPNEDRYSNANYQQINPSQRPAPNYLKGFDLDDSVSQDIQMFEDAYSDKNPYYGGAKVMKGNQPNYINRDQTEELNTLIKENESIKIKNAALLREIDFLNKQKKDLMDDTFTQNESAQIYKNQINHLSDKAQEYRKKAQELEQSLLETEKKRAEYRKQLDVIEYTNMENKTGLDKFKALADSHEKNLKYYQDRNAELENQIQQARLDSIELRSKATRSEMLEKLVSSLEQTIQKGKDEKIELCGVVSDLRQQLNESEDLRLKSKQDETLAGEKLSILQKENEVLKIKVKNLEGAYQNEYGNIGSAFELNQKTKKLEVDLEYQRKENTKIEKEKSELVGVLDDLREQLNLAEEKIEISSQEKLQERQQLEYELSKLTRELKDAKNDLRELQKSKIQPEITHTNYNSRRSDQQHTGDLELFQELDILREAVERLKEENQNLQNDNQNMLERLEDNVLRLQDQGTSKNGKNDNIQYYGDQSGFGDSLKSLNFANQGQEIGDDEFWHMVRERLDNFGIDVPQEVNQYNILMLLENLISEFHEKEERLLNLQEECHDIRTENLNLMQRQNYSDLEVNQEYPNSGKELEENKQLRVQLSQLQGEIEYLEEQNKSLQAKQRSSFENIERDKQSSIKFKELNELLESKNTQIQKLQNELKSLRNAHAEESQGFEALISELRLQLTTLETKYSRFEAENEVLKKEIVHPTTQEIDKKVEEERKINQAIASSKLTAEQNIHEEQIQKLRQRIREFEDEKIRNAIIISQLDKRIGQAQRVNTDHEDNIKYLEDQNHHKDKKIKELEKDIETLKEQRMDSFSDMNIMSERLTNLGGEGGIYRSTVLNSPGNNMIGSLEGTLSKHGQERLISSLQKKVSDQLLEIEILKEKLQDSDKMKQQLLNEKLKQIKNPEKRTTVSNLLLPGVENSIDSQNKSKEVNRSMLKLQIVEEEQNELRRKIQDLKVENQILQEDLKEAQGKINSKDLVIRELKDSKENQNQTNIIALKTKISSLETEVSKLRQSEIKAHMAQNEAEEKVTKLNQEIQKLQHEKSLGKSSHSHKVNSSDLDKEREEIIHQLSISVQELSLKIKTLENEIEEKDSMIEELNEEKETLYLELAKYMNSSSKQLIQKLQKKETSRCNSSLETLKTRMKWRT